MLKNILAAVSLIFFSCSPFQQKQNQLHKTIVAGNYDQAEKVLDKNLKYESNSRNKLLYYMDRGIVAYLNGEYEKSNEYFNLADNIHEDQKSNVGDLLLRYTVSPSMTTYLGEDHEIFFIHYYKTLNYLALEKIDDALVECRRLNTELEVLSDKYKKQEDCYSRDAFAHTLMGLVYQASNDFNNSFIAYRNAIEIFEDPVYKKNFHVEMPEQLKKDIIYVAYRMMDYDQMKFYQEKFDLQDYDPSVSAKEGGDVICFWNNGVCPSKEEFSITFIVGRAGDMITFSNLELGLFFVFPCPSEDIFRLNVVRIAVPRYRENFSIVDGGILKIDSTKKYVLEKLENVKFVAMKTLSQRMHYELGEMLLRFAIKKVSELSLNKVHEGLGVAMNIFNSFTEQADTRNWKNLPYEIFYSRIHLPEGEYQITLKPTFNAFADVHTKQRFLDDSFSKKNIKINKMRTTFVHFDTLFGSVK